MRSHGPSACAGACCRPEPCAPSRRARSRCCRASAKAPGGCRTPPPRCRRACSATCAAKKSPICARRPAARPRSSPFAGARVTAVDRSAARLSRLRENLARLALQAETVAADALEWRKSGQFDAVLLDAPCSSTGTIRRHPDVPWLKSEADIAALTSLQQRLLDRAVDLLKPGATLVYCVCSLEPEEAEDQIAALLARDPRVARTPVAAPEVVRPRRIPDRGRRPAHAAAATARPRSTLGWARRFLCRPAHPPRILKSALSTRRAYWTFGDPSLSCGLCARIGPRRRGRAPS